MIFSNTPQCVTFSQVCTTPLLITYKSYGVFGKTTDQVSGTLNLIWTLIFPTGNGSTTSLWMARLDYGTTTHSTGNWNLPSLNHRTKLESWTDTRKKLKTFTNTRQPLDKRATTPEWRSNQNVCKSIMNNYVFPPGFLLLCTHFQLCHNH